MLFSSEFSTRKKQHYVIVCVLCFSFATPVFGDTVTATYSGIGGGFDYVGAFGLANSSLDGASFSAAFTFDTSLGQQFSSSDPGYLQNYDQGGSWVGTVSPVLGVTLTINGHSVNLSGSGFGKIYAAPNVVGDPQVEAEARAGNTTVIYDYVTGNVSPLLPADYTTPFTWDTSMGGHGSGDSYIWNSATSSYDWTFTMSPTSLVVTTAVPEPETYAMMLAGLGLLGFAACRRKLQA